MPEPPPTTPPPPPARRAEGGLRLAGRGPAATGAPGQPLVSYVTVVRNAAATLPRTLASVRAQRWPAVEHVVVDGLSSDGTLEVIQAHAGQIDYFVSEPDGGLYDALNKALGLARGDLVCVLNADDWLTPDAAGLAARAWQRLAGDQSGEAVPALICTSAWLEGGRRRKLWVPAELDAGSWLRCPKICHNGVYASQAALRLTGPYDTRLRIVADTQWLCRARDAGVQVVRSAAPTVHYAAGGLSSDLGRHVQECARLLALRFPALDDAEAWTLVHAFYPWADNLQAYTSTRPAHLGHALQALQARHAGDAALQACLQAAGLARQLGQAQRVRRHQPLPEKLQRGLARAWYGTRDALGLS